MIDNNKWSEGQKKEHEFHDKIFFTEGIIHYGKSYDQYFKYLDINKDLDGKKIIEIGSGLYPALSYCHNGIKVVYEPLKDKRLDVICEMTNIHLCHEIIEDENTVIESCDEIWILNLLQHVINPDIIIDKSKEKAKIIRFFEPINTGLDQCHHHTFSIYDYMDYFGDCVKEYGANSGIENFHQHECAFGIWKR